MKLPRFSLTRRKTDLADELTAHLEMATSERMERGETVEDARRNAIREMGNLPLIEDVTRAMWGGVWMERILQDARFALRQTRRAPGFAATVIVTLSLGLGATLAMYTVVDRVMLRPLPYRDVDLLLQIDGFNRDGEMTPGPVFLDIEQWQQRSQGLEGVAFYSAPGGAGHMDFLEHGDRVVAVVKPEVSANLFPILDVHAALGRTFLVGRGGGVRPETHRFKSCKVCPLPLSERASL